MRHKVEGRTLGREKGHRKALLRNLVSSLIINERIKTTHTKALETKKLAERVITYAKKGTVHHQRLIFSIVHDRDLVKKVMTDIAPKLSEHNGGYTRIIKNGYRRGDSAPMSLIEWIYYLPPEPKKSKKED
ncbi:MAG: 50S ribosomal protein L17 [Candidatus Cloacimonetes bacterium]|nr:50S ribosomal protein L17 [Candidatus Cloacimonadota bacterium]